jgi:hypothetical protein
LPVLREIYFNLFDFDKDIAQKLFPGNDATLLNVGLTVFKASELKTSCVNNNIRVLAPYKDLNNIFYPDYLSTKTNDNFQNSHAKKATFDSSDNLDDLIFTFNRCYGVPVFVDP